MVRTYILPEEGEVNMELEVTPSAFVSYEILVSARNEFSVGIEPVSSGVLTGLYRFDITNGSMLEGTSSSKTHIKIVFSLPVMQEIVFPSWPKLSLLG